MHQIHAKGVYISNDVHNCNMSSYFNVSTKLNKLPNST
jgi:hypothetical protein